LHYYSPTAHLIWGGEITTPPALLFEACTASGSAQYATKVTGGVRFGGDLKPSVGGILDGLPHVFGESAYKGLERFRSAKCKGRLRR